MSADPIVRWVEAQFSSILELNKPPPINIIVPHEAIHQPVHSLLPCIYLSVLRKSVPIDASRTNELSITNRSLIFGLHTTLNLLHSAIKDKRVSCIVVVRTEDLNSTQDENKKCRATDTLKAIRQLALFAMEYGGVYVGSVRLNSQIYENSTSEIQVDESSTLRVQRVLREALDFNGPSIILLNSDCSYRWFPFPTVSKHASKETASFSTIEPDEQLEESNQFVWDEEETKKPPALQKFLENNQELHLLLSQTPQLSDDFICQLPKSSHLWQSYHRRLLLESEASNSLSPIRRLLVLFGSDGGHAEGLARRLAKESPHRGVHQCLCLPLDSITKIPSMLNELIDQDESDRRRIDGCVVIVVSTAGQGEFPGNAKKFWKRLSSEDQTTLLNGVRYAVFGLGDSAYWPNDPEYFGKPSKDIDAKIALLGGVRIVDMGLGNDQDSDKYETAWRYWVQQFWSMLGWERTVEDGIATEPEAEVLTDEEIKLEANHLRGTLKTTLDDITTGQVPYNDQKTIKFHGIYQQDHREYRSERASLGLEPFYSFMVRVRLPGGICTANQWVAMDHLSSIYGDQTMKITTRQTFQLHGILKRNLKKTIQEMNRACMDTICACGDVNRNVLTTSTPGLCSEQTYQIVQHYATELSEFVLPHSLAYHEIFLEGPNDEISSKILDNRLKNKKIKVGGSYFSGQGMCPKKLDQVLTDDVEEPLYGATYLPRKFKVAIAIPPVNDVDVFAHCVGLIADISKTENPQISDPCDVLNVSKVGFTVIVGGGMGRTHNDPKTYPRLAEPLGFCRPEEAKIVLSAAMALQRDYGDRSNRKHARFKYTVEDLGIEQTRRKIIELSGIEIQPPKNFAFTTRGDCYGWNTDLEGNLHYGMFIEGGRVVDTEEKKLKTCLREIAKINRLEFRLTCNQNVIISHVEPAAKSSIDELLCRYNCAKETFSPMRLNSIACVALPTCPLAMAESERYLPKLVTRVEEIMKDIGIEKEDVLIRMTGCPNGCARPYVSEIGLVGRSLGFYDLYLGGDHVGKRLSRKYAEGINEEIILKTLKELLK